MPMAVLRHCQVQYPAAQMSCLPNGNGRPPVPSLGKQSSPDAVTVHVVVQILRPSASARQTRPVAQPASEVQKSPRNPAHGRVEAASQTAQLERKTASPPTHSTRSCDAVQYRERPVGQLGSGAAAAGMHSA